MVQFFCDGKLLYDPRNPDYAIDSPKCELEVNKTGSLTFRIAPTHPLYTEIHKLKSEIVVYQDNEYLAGFRVLNTDLDFQNIMSVSCEGELAYLLDSIQRAEEYHDISVADYFAALISNHNADVDESKRFELGVVNVTDSNDSLAFKENGQTIAYISNQSLVITNAEIKNKLSLGTADRGWFDFIPRTTGNLSIQWRDPLS